MITLTSKQRSMLRSTAANEDTIMQIGKNGLTEALIKTVGDALTAREIVKLRVLESAPGGVRETAEDLAAATDATLVCVIGTKCVLYREAPDPAKRKIAL